jgi:rubrerythrin
MNVKGTKTEQNILKAFAGESQARNRSTFAASQARKDGFMLIADIFEETANQEREHAKRLFNLLEGGEVEITETYPAGKPGSTADNQRSAAGGEHHEFTSMYPGFAQTAQDEGLNAVAVVFRSIAVAEKQHEKRFTALLAHVENGTAFKRDQPVRWRCRNCGYVHEGLEAPKACPACIHPQAYFEVLMENY